MSAALPRSKSRAFITARIIRAFASDLRIAADDFDKAAIQYESGWTEERKNGTGLAMYAALSTAHGGWTLARTALLRAKKSLGVHL